MGRLTTGKLITGLTLKLKFNYATGLTLELKFNYATGLTLKLKFTYATNYRQKQKPHGSLILVLLI